MVTIPYMTLLSKCDLEKSGFSCNFIEYIALKMKTAKNIGNLNITKEEWPNIPLLLSLVGNKKRLFIYL